MKLVICGDSELTDESAVQKAIDYFKLTGITEVISGDCKGADRFGENWAKKQGLLVKKFPAKWKDLDAPGAVIKSNAFGKYNANAGFDRNKVMVDYGDAVLALELSGKTPGTQNTIKYAKEKEKPVYEYTGQDKEYKYVF